jgi:hypothetical protein
MHIELFYTFLNLLCTFETGGSCPIQIQIADREPVSVFSFSTSLDDIHKYHYISYRYAQSSTIGIFVMSLEQRGEFAKMKISQLD